MTIPRVWRITLAYPKTQNREIPMKKFCFLVVAVVVALVAITPATVRADCDGIDTGDPQSFE